MTDTPAAASPPTRPGHVHVVGTGLIGTSVALAARAAGWKVGLSDRDPRSVDLAVAVGAGDAESLEDAAALGDTAPTAVVVAVPPRETAGVIADVLRATSDATVIHVASAQSRLQQQVKMLGSESVRVVGTHPVAGRERGGAHHAVADLFRDRAWLVCPTSETEPQHVAAAERLAVDCGGIVHRLDPYEHDRLLARLSHAPQLVASALAAGVLDVPAGQARLAGAGLRDTTRLADGDPELWAQIATANAPEVAAALAELVMRLDAVVLALSGEEGAAAVGELIAAGRAGREAMGGKHGRGPSRWATVTVVVPDEAGRLARLLADADRAHVNVEDIRVDHAVGQPLGLVDLDVRAVDRRRLHDALEGSGWSVTSSPPM